MYSNKTFQKIYLKIDSIAKKGILGQTEYNIYIDDIINAGQFYILKDVLYTKYGIPSYQMGVLEIKSNTFNSIRFKTTSSFQEDLQSLYSSSSVYQMGQDIYVQSTSLKLGTIISLTSTSNVSPSGMTSSKILNVIPTLTSLSVLRSDNVLIELNDASTTLINKYKSAIHFLLIAYSTTTSTTSTTTTAVPTTSTTTSTTTIVPTTTSTTTSTTTDVITTTSTTTTTTTLNTPYTHTIMFNIIDGGGSIYGWIDSSTVCMNTPNANIIDVYSDSSIFTNGINLYQDAYGTSLSSKFRQDYPYQYYYYAPDSTTFNMSGYVVYEISPCLVPTTSTTTTTTTDVPTTTTTTTSTTTTTTTLTIVNTVSIGGGSLLFNGSSQQYLSITASTDFSPGTGDFTVEWFQNQQLGSDPFPRAFTLGESPNATLSVSVEDGVLFTWINGIGNSATMSSWQDTWTHLAFCRYGGTVSVYQDGVELMRFFDNSDITNVTNNLLIGNDTAYLNLSQFQGRITNFHFVNGTALYTSNFSRPISTLIRNTNTKLLLLCNNELNVFNDSSISNKQIDIQGVTWSFTNPFSSWYLAGTYSDAGFNGEITFPNHQASSYDLNPNHVGQTDGLTYNTQLYINSFDSNGLSHSNLTQLSGNSGTINLTQGTNSVNYSFTTGSFNIKNTSSLQVYYDTVYGTGSSGSISVLTPSLNDFNITDPVSISYTIQNSFILTTNDIVYRAGSNNIFDNNLTGFSSNGVGNIGGDLIVYELNTGTFSKTTEIQNILLNNNLLLDSTGYMWDVTWGTGSSYSTGVVRMGMNTTGGIYMSPVDTTDGSWLINYTPVGFSFPPTPSLAGTFNFPAQFTLHNPIISDGNSWC